MNTQLRLWVESKIRFTRPETITASMPMPYPTLLSRICWSLIAIVPLCSFASVLDQQSTPTQMAKRVFKHYIAQAEGVDSDANKIAMQQALTELRQSARPSDLPLLINIWMYYDPADFSTRELIDPIFENDKNATLIAIEKRLKRKKKWESAGTAPFSDLLALRNKFISELHP